MMKKPTLLKLSDRRLEDDPAQILPPEVAVDHDREDPPRAGP